MTELDQIAQRYARRGAADRTGFLLPYAALLGAGRAGPVSRSRRRAGVVALAVAGASARRSATCANSLALAIAYFSIWRTRSRVTPMRRPIASNVSGSPVSAPDRARSTNAALGSSCWSGARIAS